MKSFIRKIVKRKNTVLFLRFTILCLLIFPAKLYTAIYSSQEIVVCLDFSRSNEWLHAQKKISLQDLYIDKIQKIMDTLSSRDRLGIIGFATECYVIKKLNDDRIFTLPRYTGNIDSSQINLALAKAITMFSSHQTHKTIAVYSDGLFDDINPNFGKQLANKSISMKFEYLETPTIKNLQDIAIESMRLPYFAKQGQTIHGELVVRTSHKTDAILQIQSGEKIIEKRRVFFSEKGKYSLYFFLNILEQKNVNISVKIRTSEFIEKCLENNTYQQEIKVNQKIKILEFGKQLQQMNLPFFIVDSFQIPPQDLDLEQYDIIVVSDVHIDKIKHLDKFISKHTGNGRGLMMIASPKTFASGGYYSSDIEKALPVWTAPRQKNNMTIMILLDISGSMNEKYGNTIKIEAAKKAILKISKYLDGDSLELVAFNSRVEDIFKTGDFYEKISQIKANGETKIVPAIQYVLQKKSNKKHIIVISDGEIQKNVPGQLGILPKKTSLSVISTGKNNNSLREISAWGKGSFYEVQNQNLHEIIEHDLLKTKGKLFISKTTKTVKKSKLLWDGQDYENKYINKYVLTKKKPLAKNLLQTETGDALLSVQDYKLGKSAALMTNREWTSNLPVENLVSETLLWLAPNYNNLSNLFISYRGNQLQIRKDYPKHNQKFVIHPLWLNKRFTMQEQQSGVYTLDLFGQKSPFYLKLEHQKNPLEQSLVKFQLPYSPEYANLTQIMPYTKNSNKNSNTQKNMDNILMSIAIICFLIERFITKGM
ncbi:VWA domain-containing protein [Candidatus Uabimicrobium sp. HlEnr_7]|uniref:VWA domain-containing protein n=1 Tax=Candidatus Uabimicrobium helgolandensis TaxID=3095367 RepID=UPI003557A6AF